MNAKQIIFNVGAGFCSYFESDDKKIMFDLGKRDDFCPIEDFLQPLFNKRNNDKKDDKYFIDQLFISHPHNDHMAAIKEFDKSFYAELVTCPNDNDGMSEGDKINWELIDNKNQELVKYLREKVIKDRKPPLKSSAMDRLFVYYIPPSECETNSDIDVKNYSNNISIVCYLEINEHKILIPGDIMKDGMKYIIKRTSSLRNKLENGIDFLITPHHGLKSSFSQYLFNHINDNKTKRLNIVPEEVTTEDSNRQVDSRYSSKDYCNGKNNLSTEEEKVFQRKTSSGHILIDYSDSVPLIKIYKDDELDQLMKEFI